MNILNASREWAIACLGGIRMTINSHWVPIPRESGILGLHGWNELEREENEDSYIVVAEYPQPVVCPASPKTRTILACSSPTLSIVPLVSLGRNAASNSISKSRMAALWRFSCRWR